MISQYENDVGGKLTREWAYSPQVLNVIRSYSSESIIANRDLISYRLEPRSENKILGSPYHSYFSEPYVWLMMVDKL